MINNQNKHTLTLMGEVDETKAYLDDKLLNSIVVDFALNVFGNMNIIDQPVCPKCETPALWDMNNNCYCPKCGTFNRVGVLTFRDYIKQELLKGGR